MTAAFGGLNVFQFVRDYVHGRLWRERMAQIVAFKASMIQLRAMLTEAGNTENIIKSDAGKQFLANIGHQVKTMEHFVDAILASEGVVVGAGEPPAAARS